jgi:hypothetical protein
VNYSNLSANMNRLHAKAVATIFSTRDGSTSFINSDNGRKYIGDERYSASSTTYSHGLKNFVTRADIDHVKMILDSLHFRGIAERRAPSRRLIKTRSGGPGRNRNRVRKRVGTT